MNGRAGLGTAGGAPFGVPEDPVEVTSAMKNENGCKEIGLLAIDDGLAAPYEASDLAAGVMGTGIRVSLLPSAAVCATCGEGACDHHPERYRAARQAYLDLAATCRKVVVAAAGSSASLALLLAANEPSRVRGTILVRPRLAAGAPKEAWVDRMLRRLAWPACLLVGAEPEFVARDGGNAKPPEERVGGLGHRLVTIRQPSLIIHARGRRCDDFDDAWLLQRKLAGMVEMVTLNVQGDGCHAGLGETVIERMSDFIVRASAMEPKAAVASMAAASGRPAGAAMAVQDA